MNPHVRDRKIVIVREQERKNERIISILMHMQIDTHTQNNTHRRGKREHKRNN